MQKIKTLKGKSLKKHSYVELDNEIILPLKTLSIIESKDIDLRTNMTIPRKVRPATQEEKEELMRTDPNYNTRTQPMIAEYDKDSPEYIEYLEQHNKLQNILNVIKYIDMDYIIEDENGNKITLWEDIGVSKGDWENACIYFGEELCLSDADLTKIYTAVKVMQKDTIFEKLDKFEKLTNKYNVYEILALIDKVALDDTVEERYAEHIIKHNEQVISNDNN